MNSTEPYCKPTYVSRIVLRMLPSGPSYFALQRKTSLRMDKGTNARSSYTLETHLRIGRPQQLAPERLPRKLLGFPLHLITMNAHVITNKFRPHDHEECIEYIQWGLVLDRYKTTVESSSEFDYLGCLPGCIKFFCGALELFACTRW